MNYMKEDRSIVSIDELITTFTGIDKRIGELHSHLQMSSPH